MSKTKSTKSSAQEAPAQDAAAAASPAPDAGAGTNTPEGRSGTAREASSAGSGGEAPASSGAQPAAHTITVTGPAGGRRRAGRAFGATPVTLSLAYLTDDELAAIKADPLLTVVETVAD